MPVLPRATPTHPQNMTNRQKVADGRNDVKITVYTTPACSQCNLTKKWLDDPSRGNLKGQYDVVDLADNPADLAAVKALGYAAAPVVIVNHGDTQDETHWFGFRPDMLAQYCKAQEVAA